MFDDHTLFCVAQELAWAESSYPLPWWTQIALHLGGALALALLTGIVVGYCIYGIRAARADRRRWRHY